MTTYQPNGVCSSKIEFDVKNNKIHNCSFTDGCSGNAKGIGSLVEGMEIDEVIKRLSGIICGRRDTSCPDQLAKALGQYK
jgi:uncharacterized protein (TIGR03905 family)